MFHLKCCFVFCRYHGPNTGNMHTVADLYAEVLGVLAQSKYVEKTELLIYVWISFSLLAVKSLFLALLGFSMTCYRSSCLPIQETGTVGMTNFWTGALHTKLGLEINVCLFEDLQIIVARSKPIRQRYGWWAHCIPPFQSAFCLISRQKCFAERLFFCVITICTPCPERKKEPVKNTTVNLDFQREFIAIFSVSKLHQLWCSFDMRNCALCLRVFKL